MGHSEDPPRLSQHDTTSPRSTLEVAQHAVEFTKQAEKLSHQRTSDPSPVFAVQADFVTPRDPVIVTSDGNRLPGVPLHEAHKLNVLREELQGQPGEVEIKKGDELQAKASNPAVDHESGEKRRKSIQLTEAQDQDGSALQQPETLRRAMPPSHTNPLFPPLPLYGPPSFLRNIQCWLFRITSFVLSLEFLGVIVLGSLFTSIPAYFKALFLPSHEKKRPFYEQELQNAAIRKEKEKDWDPTGTQRRLDVENETIVDEYPPTEGGRDPIICDVGYYARRVGLDVETFKVETEDGFIIELWHVYDPKEHTPLDEASREKLGPTVFQEAASGPGNESKKRRKFPVLLMHGLLQSSGAYCCNDDQSLAFWLCKSGFDVWLGNNRCGFKPEHVLLDYGDPRMWCWNIRQMGVFDLPALISRVLHETGFAKIGLICHSQGTTQTLVALAKEQRPDLGEKLTVFCALAPAAYAGPLIGKMYFKFMRIISPAMFRLMFGIHAFIPFMMQMHALLDPRLYGWLGYKVFSFLFDWTDERWDRGLRDRMFQFAPVYVSAESMRWWLGRECFAKHKCILATREVLKAEESLDEATSDSDTGDEKSSSHAKGSTAWYNEQAPPFALWVCGDDHLVDGKRLLRRFEAGREPHVRVVHSKVIPEYQHLDVIWAMDAAEQVFREIREVLWKTCDARDICSIPEGCDMVSKWEPAEAVATARMELGK
ncbi:triglyceride lipase-cholesterol esterase [Trichoderma arundinaceum]|uniref:Triglyceride lipase-cholesterol esterase n=1 Tax=Trichoderma arundinaceum TaxID=490622 RepID=A0A395NJZ3_TRIAR|nr:triglyceride lipase-cholesterol esterase [Trichoderma arundinaceum]